MNQISTFAIERDDSADDILFLDLAGPLRLSDARGADLTPTARKAQGLLALVGTAPGLRRSRAWLQDKLWSDRAPEQGAASLRQCLRSIRLSLGPHVGCLRTGSGWVALDPDRVRVRTAPSGPELAGTEFLEGLEIRDPEFEHWLRDQRMRYGDRWDGGAAGRTGPDPAPGNDDRFGEIVAAAALADYLLRRRDGPQMIRRMMQEDIRAGYAAPARDLRSALAHVLAGHPEAARAAR
jgi:hypothetical protein